MTDTKKIAIDKEREFSELQNSREARQQERAGLRRPMKLSISDEWCLEMARRELEADEREARPLDGPAVPPQDAKGGAA
jgi:hypothetical protein